MQGATDNRPGGRAWDNLPPSVSGPTERGLLQRLKSRVMRLVPRPLVRALARPYIAGESRADAVELVRRLKDTRDLFSTVDVLGEDIRDPAEAGEMLDEYIAILDDLGASPHANISVKLSALGQALDEELCARNLDLLLARAARYGQFVRFDMEDHTTTDSTLRLFRRFVGKYPKIGPVLQSRLHRTEQDVRDLAPYKPNVRLCIGIYREPPDIALVDKREMKQRMLRLLEMMWSNGQYVGIATHDEAVIHNAVDLADRMGKSAADYEVQMLLGVPRSQIQKEMQRRGVKVRLYVPYGRQWYAYCLRRLEGNPEMARMVLGNLLNWRRG
ncbi:MAG TPA: proline dehydrogenase family protein [Patescibacteria group bacterium]|jgi:proline dehydrogenase|nr:proline dehydrogenase family protein [Patescibacteria group bacterium]